MLDPNSSAYHFSRLFVSVGLLLTLISCWPAGLGPQISEFDANPSVIAPDSDAEVILRWKVGNAESARISLEAIPESGPGPTRLADDLGGQERFIVKPKETTTFRLIASSPEGTSSREVRVRVAEPGDPGGGGGTPAPAGDGILILIAGQSNATGEGEPFPEGKETSDPGVFMLTHGDSPSQWEWVRAEEPMTSGHGHSFGVRMGNELRRATGKEVYLVPAAVGGTSAGQWQPGSAGTGLFESAVNRAKYAAKDLDVNVSAVAWMQGESDSAYSSSRRSFIDNTERIFQGFRNQLPGSPPILYAQLAKRLHDPKEEGRNVAYQEIRESQRLMAAGAVQAAVVAAGSSPPASSEDRPYYHMVVAHDLPMSDIRHVSRDGQKALGSRFAEAFLRNAWSGTGSKPAAPVGPRLVALVREGPSAIRVRVSSPVNDSTSYSGYFTLFSDGAEVAIAGVERDPGDSRSILITAAGTLSSNNANIIVRYMPPDDTAMYQGSTDVIKDANNMPLPAFGASPAEFVPSGFMMAY